MAYQGYEEFKESRAVSGVGAGLYVKDATDGKYSLAVLLETVPSVAGSNNTIDVDVTGSGVIGKILGKQSIDDKEVEFLLHRDNVLRLKELSGVQNEYMIVTQDYMGWGFTGVITYKFDDLSSGDAAKGTMTITASTIDEEPILNALPYLKKTIKFTNVIPNQVTISASGTKTVPVEISDTGTVTCTSDLSSVTGAWSNGVLTITSTTASGSGILKITASGTGLASWTTTIVVIVES